MRQNINNINPDIGLNPCNFYDNFLSAYQNNISNILLKLRKSRKNVQKLKYLNKDLQQDNIYLRQEINRLEKEDEKVRDLLSMKTKILRDYEFNNSIYSIDYRIKYLDSDGQELYSDWYPTETGAFKSISNNNDFVIEKRYIKRSWGDDMSSDDNSD